MSDSDCLHIFSSHALLYASPVHEQHRFPSRPKSHKIRLSTSDMKSCGMTVHTAADARLRRHNSCCRGTERLKHKLSNPKLKLSRDRQLIETASFLMFKKNLTEIIPCIVVDSVLFFSPSQMHSYRKKRYLGASSKLFFFRISGGDSQSPCNYHSRGRQNHA